MSLDSTTATSHTAHCFCQRNTGGFEVCCGCGIQRTFVTMGQPASLPSVRAGVDLTKLANVLVNVAQVFDGWHADGTAWTSWDESVRRDVSDQLRALADAGGKMPWILTERPHVALCTCSIITGGHRVPTPGCPLHGSRADAEQQDKP